MKKVVLIIMAVCMIATLAMATAHASVYYNCRVIQTGVSNGSYYINLTDTAATPAFTARWFTIPTAYANQFLATALTAISTGQTVQAGFAGSTTPAQLATPFSLYANNQ